MKIYESQQLKYFKISSLRDRHYHSSTSSSLLVLWWILRDLIKVGTRFLQWFRQCVNLNDSSFMKKGCYERRNETFLFPLTIWVLTYQYNKPYVGTCPNIVLYLASSVAAAGVIFFTSKLERLGFISQSMNFSDVLKSQKTTNLLSNFSVCWFCNLHCLDLCNL